MAMDSIIEDLLSSDTKGKVTALEKLLPELRELVDLRHLEVTNQQRII
jgi:hypothetical protein